MKILKNFIEFISENNNYIYNFIYDKITEEEFNNYIFSELINESFLNNDNIFSIIKDKMLNTILSFIEISKKAGMNVIPKLINLIKKWSSYITKLSTNHSELASGIKIFITISLLILISFNIQAKNPNKGNIPTFDIKDSCTAIMGVIKEFDENGEDKEYHTIFLKAEEFLKLVIDEKLYKDPKGDELYGNLPSEIQQVINDANLKTNKLFKKVYKKQDQEALKYIQELIYKGNTALLSFN
jgi:hypothetical protein